MTSNTPPETQAERHEESAQLSQTALFIRQLAHDLNNDLNALDLAATYVSEMVHDSSATEELAIQRKTIQNMSTKLKSLSRHLHPPSPSPITIAASDFLEEIRDRATRAYPSEISAITWNSEVGSHQVSVDFEMACEAFGEVVKNAILHRDDGGKIEFQASTANGTLRVEIWNGKQAPLPFNEPPGEQPFIPVSRRSYGLGLYYARRVILAHGGKMSAQHDSRQGRFRVEILLPTNDQ